MSGNEGAAAVEVAAQAFAGYVPPAVAAGTRWFLDANEGKPGRFVVEALAATDAVEAIRRYPRATALEADIEARPGMVSTGPGMVSARPERLSAGPAPGIASLPAGSVLVTAGSDDAIARACRVYLGRGDRLLVFEPAFEMYAISSRLVGAEPLGVAWPEGTGFPLGAAIDAGRRSGAKAVAVATPANPTGTVTSPEELLELADALPEASIWVDGAYGEFAERDTLGLILARPNILVMRTFSKAYGLAGMRLGWVAGPSARIAALRGAGAPYPVGGLSVVAGLAARSPEGLRQKDAFVERVKKEREDLYRLFVRLGARPAPSEANFILARVRSPQGVKASLAQAGIAIRVFAGRAGLEDAIRISCPGEEEGWAALEAALVAAKEWL